MFNIQDFIVNNRIKYLKIDNWEHNNRGCCFVNNDTVAVPFKPSEDDFDFDGGVEGDIYEIRLYKTDGSVEFSIIKFQSILNLDGAELFFDTNEKRLYLYSSKIGLVVAHLSGEILGTFPKFTAQKYDVKLNKFIRYGNKKIEMFKVVS